MDISKSCHKFSDITPEQAIKRLGAEGILTPEDLPSLATSRWRVFLLMIDGGWHAAPSIIQAARGTEGLRRLRELRKLSGVTIERKIVSLSKRVFFYRMVVNHD